MVNQAWIIAEKSRPYLRKNRRKGRYEDTAAAQKSDIEINLHEKTAKTCSGPNGAIIASVRA